MKHTGRSRKFFAKAKLHNAEKKKHRQFWEQVSKEYQTTVQLDRDMRAAEYWCATYHLPQI